VRTGHEKDTSDEAILAALRDGGLGSVLERAGGLDVEHDWPSMASLGERQELVIAGLILARPSFAVLDRVSTALGTARLEQCLHRLTENSIGYINFDERAASIDLYDAVLQIEDNGAWNWRQGSIADGVSPHS